MDKDIVARRLIPWFALGGLAFLSFLILTPFFSPLAWSSILAYATWPIAQRIRYICKRRDNIAALISTALIACMLFLPLLWLAWLAQKELTNLYPIFKHYLTQPAALAKNLANLPLIGAWLSQYYASHVSDAQAPVLIIKSLLLANLDSLASLAGIIGKNIGKIGLVILILFFFYRDGNRITKALKTVLTRFIGQQSNHYVKAAGATARAVVYGVLLTAIVQGIVAGLGYWVAGLSSPVLFGVVTAIFALVPLGTTIAWSMAAGWLFMQGDTHAAIGVAIWGAAVVSQIDNFLRPYFISSVNPIPFLLILFGILGGLLLFGLVGLFIGPIVLSVAWSVWSEWARNMVNE